MKSWLKRKVAQFVALICGPARLSQLRHSSLHRDDVLIICFSRDRALQLDALLRSMKMYVFPLPRVLVIFSTSSDAHQESYLDVQARHQDTRLEFVPDEQQGSFRATVLHYIRSSSCKVVGFLVDDDVFLRATDIVEVAGWVSPDCVPTLRHGVSLRRNEVQDVQELPRFLVPSPQCGPSVETLIIWRWWSNSFAWSVPLALDGHLYNINELEKILQDLIFESPTSLELAMQSRNSAFLGRFGLSYLLPCIVNLAVNQVQCEATNLHGSLHQDMLLDIWNSGRQIKLSELDGLIPPNTHIVPGFHYEARSM